jgi:hypothetical protein
VASRAVVREALRSFEHGHVAKAAALDPVEALRCE